MYSSLEYYGVSFWVFFLWPLFSSLLWPIKYCYPGFFSPCPFTWNIFFPTLYFQSCMSFVLRWITCKQNICRSCFLILSATLCLLFGAFNPFTFKVIIDRYLFIAISLSLYPSLSHSFFFPFLKAFHLAYLVGDMIKFVHFLYLVKTYYFSLLFSGKVLISSPNIIESLAG